MESMGIRPPSTRRGVGRAAVDDARDRMAALLGAKAHEIIFTGGGTESCNLGLIGIARAHAVLGKHIIISAVEHHAVLHAAEHLQHFEGFEVTLLPVDSAGVVDPALLARLIRKETSVVSIMHANNEVGCNKQTACVFVRTESTQIPSAPIGTGRQCVADR